MAAFNDEMIDGLGSPGDNATALFQAWRAANSLTGNDSISAFLVADDAGRAGDDINDQMRTYFEALP